MKARKLKCLYVFVLAVLLLFINTNMTAFAATVAKGTCGTGSYSIDAEYNSYDEHVDVVWTLDDQGVLRIRLDDLPERSSAADVAGQSGTITEYAWDSSKVRSVVIGSGLRIPNDSIFMNHKNLEKVTLPKDYGYLGERPFAGCDKLTEIKGETGYVLKGFYGNTYYGAFEKHYSLKTIPPIADSRIQERAFFDCSSLNHVVLLEGVTAIGENAFSNCRSLSDVKLPSTLKELGWGAFDCCNLKELVIPKGVTEIPADCFSANSNLKSVTIPDSVTRIGASAFQFCALKEIKLSKYITSIDGTDWGDINSYPFDKGVVIDAPAGSYAAKWAKEHGFTLKGEKKADVNPTADNAKKTVKTKAGTFTINGKEAAFTAPANKNAVSLSIPAKVKGVKVTAIAPSACAKMKKLKKVTIPSGITKIGKKAFYNCSKLKSIVIKTKKLTSKSVGTKAFKGINKKAVIKCPKAKKASYKKILLKKGMKKTVKFKG